MWLHSAQLSASNQAACVSGAGPRQAQRSGVRAISCCSLPLALFRRPAAASAQHPARKSPQGGHVLPRALPAPACVANRGAAHSWRGAAGPGQGEQGPHRVVVGVVPALTYVAGGSARQGRHETNK